MNISEFEDAYEDVYQLGDTILATPVSELMAHNPLVVEADASVLSVVNAMNEHHVGCVLVQKEGKLIGIFTERDALRRVIFRDGNRSWPVEAAMTRDPSTLPPGASVAFALNKMSLDGYRHIPIVDRAGKAIGVISIKDIIKLVVEAFPGRNLINLPPDPTARAPAPTDGSGGSEKKSNPPPRAQPGHRQFGVGSLTAAERHGMIRIGSAVDVNALRNRVHVPDHFGSSREIIGSFLRHFQLRRRRVVALAADFCRRDETVDETAWDP